MPTPTDYVTNGMSKSAIKRWYRQCATTVNDNGIFERGAAPNVKRCMLEMFHAFMTDPDERFAPEVEARYAACRPRST